MGPRAGMDGRKFSSPQRFDPGPSSPQSVAIPTELPGPHNIITLIIYMKYNIILSIYPSSFITAVAVFQKPNAIPLCFSIYLFLNFLLSWLLVLLPSTFFLDVLHFFSPVVPIP